MWFDEREARQRYQERLKHAARQQYVRRARSGQVGQNLLLTNRDFALLWWGGLVSLIGGWALQIGLPVHVYEITGSTLATGLIFMVGTLPRILLGTVAGIFVDRWDRKRTLIITNLLLGLGVLPLMLVPLTGWLWLVYVVAFLQALLSRFFIPAENAFLPSVVDEEQLAAANALNALNNNLARLIGPALGGLAIGTVGLSGVVVLDAASFLLAAGAVALVRKESPPLQKDESKATSIISGLEKMWRAWLDGLKLVTKDPLVSLLFIIVAVASVGEGAMATMFIPFVTDVLRGEAVAVGWLLSAQAVGGIAGGVWVAGLARRVAPSQLLGWGGLGLGIIDLVIFNYPSFIPGILPALLLIALAGLPVSAYSTGLLTLLQTGTEDRYRGRVFGAYGATMALFNLIGMGLAGVLGDPLGIVLIINVQGLGYVIAGLLGLTLLQRRVSG